MREGGDKQDYIYINIAMLVFQGEEILIATLRSGFEDVKMKKKKNTLTFLNVYQANITNNLVITLFHSMSHVHYRIC